MLMVVFFSQFVFGEGLGPLAIQPAPASCRTPLSGLKRMAVSGWQMMGTFAGTALPPDVCSTN